MKTIIAVLLSALYFFAPLCAEKYTNYDSAGHIAKEIFTGNLTGHDRDDEEYTIEYTYDGDHLISRRSSDGREWRYCYTPSGQLETRLLMADGQILERVFHRYDGEELYETITDDGDSNERDDLSTVHLRQIRRLTPVEDGVRLELLTQDPITGGEILVSAQEHLYNSRGDLAATFCFDDVGAYTHGSLLEHDEAGAPQWRMDSSGEVIDLSLPSFASDTPVDNVQSRVHNERGQPIRIVYKDGTSEQFTYTLDGKIATHQQRQGITIRYAYDGLDREVGRTVLDANDQVIEEKHKIYNGHLLVAESDHSGTLRHYHYDVRGRLEGVDTPTHHYLILYDPSGMLQQVDLTDIHSGNTHHRYYERDERGEVEAVRIEDDHGHLLSKRLLCKKHSSSPDTIAHIFDDHGRASEEFSYDLDGTLLSHKQYSYDTHGRKTSETELATDIASTVEWAYGPLGRLESITNRAQDGLEATIRYHYNDRGLVSQIDKADGVHLYLTYDPAAHPARIWSSDGSIDYRYGRDEQGRLIEIDNHQIHYHENLVSHETLANGLTIEKDYDTLGRKTALTLPDQSRVHFTYKGELLTSISRYDASNILQYTHQYLNHSPEGSWTSAQLIGDSGTVQRQWVEGKLVSINSAWWAQELLRGPEGRPEQIVTSQADQVNTAFYRYDALGRLTTEWDGVEHHYEYDGMGNRTIIDNAAHQYNGLNQLVFDGDTLYTYDANGNMTSKTNSQGTVNYSYDALDRLTQVEQLGQWTVTYTYDAFGRRQTTTSTKNTGEQESKTLRFLYDGLDEIGAADENGNIIQLRLLGTGPGAEHGATVAIELNDYNAPLAPIHDHRGSITALVDSATGELADTYQYDAFGNEQLPSTVSNPWRYSGKRADPLTGLIYFGHRYYDPSTGRWLTQDPAGFADGTNRYTYLHNDPLSHIDYYGLWSWKGLWDSVTGAVDNFFDGIFNQFLNAPQYCLDDFAWTGLNREQIEHAIAQLVSPGLFQATGYHFEHMTTGTLGHGEVAPNIRVTFINGILTDKYSLFSCLNNISQSHGGVNVHYVYWPTCGWTWDLTRCMLVRGLNYPTGQASALVSKWRALIKEMGGTNSGGIILHYAHSVGAAETITAMRMLNRDEKKMLRIITFGSPCLDDEPEVESIKHYVSIRDGIPLFDPITLFAATIACPQHIQLLGEWSEGLPLADHFIGGATYRNAIQALGEQFVETYGNVKE